MIRDDQAQWRLRLIVVSIRYLRSQLWSPARRSGALPEADPGAADEGR